MAKGIKTGGRKAGVGNKTTVDVRNAIAGHVLGEARLTGLYTLNPKVKL